MNDQVNHLQQLVEQRKNLATDLESLTSQTTRTRELALKTQGAIEYLEAIGVKLPESDETSEVETELDSDVMIPEPEVSPV
tara:strand:- start:63 stop:305 length:243 start_codon:yes stop_codon:yes gene_type:complete